MGEGSAECFHRRVRVWVHRRVGWVAGHEGYRTEVCRPLPHTRGNPFSRLEGPRVWAGWEGLAMALPALAWAGALVHGHALCMCIGVLAYGDLRCD